MSVKAILADLGGVVVFFDNAKAAAAMGAVLGRTAEEVNAALFDRHGFRHRYQRAEISTSEFLRLVCARLQIAQADLPDERVLGQAFADVFTPNEPVIERLLLLRTNGIVVTAVSNVEELRMRQLEREGILSVFDHRVIACEEQLLKPSQEFLVRALDRSGVKAEDALYVDDIEENLRPPVQLGINVHLYRSVRELDECFDAHGLATLPT